MRTSVHRGVRAPSVESERYINLFTVLEAQRRASRARCLVLADLNDGADHSNEREGGAGCARQGLCRSHIQASPPGPRMSRDVLTQTLGLFAPKVSGVFGAANTLYYGNRASHAARVARLPNRAIPTHASSTGECVGALARSFLNALSSDQVRWIEYTFSYA